MTPLHPSHMRCKLILLLIAPLCLANLCETEETLKFFVDQQGWGASGNWNSLASMVAEEFWIEFWMVFPVFLTVSLKASSIPQPPLSEYHQMLVCLLTAASFFLYDVSSCLYVFIVSLILLCCLPLLLLPQLSRREKILRSNDAQMLNGDLGRTSKRRSNEWNSCLWKFK